MGYQITGGLGVKLADPSREVYALVGDGSYLMMAQEIVTALQEHVKINIVLLDDHGFSSIGSLSRAVELEVLARNTDIGPPPFRLIFSPMPPAWELMPYRQTPERN